MEGWFKVEGSQLKPKDFFPFSKPSPFSSMTDGCELANKQKPALQHQQTPTR
jgi:hypothetical protein